jgi:DnaK suppressor protein
VAASFQERLKNIHTSAQVEPIEFMDLAAHSEIDEMAVRTAESEARKIIEIDEALARLNDGGYGTCEGCGGKIPPKRLKAVPTASLCVQCKHREEEATLAGAGEAPDPDALAGYGFDDYDDDGGAMDDLLRDSRAGDLVD